MVDGTGNNKFVLNVLDYGHLMIKEYADLLVINVRNLIVMDNVRNVIRDIVPKMELVSC